MTSNKNVSADSSTDFVLKHRITGAAFLICFGVLFLPWLLGAPSEANKNAVTQIAENDDEITPDQIEQELLTVVDNAQIEDVEVYVSKITPLDSQPNNDNEVEAEVENRSEPEQEYSEEISIAKPVPKAETAAAERIEKEMSAPENVEVIDDAEVEVIDNSIEVGWVVQVGVFTDQKGAEKVVSDLKARGFSPSTTVVDTNQGKASATRVWLGPYAQRVEAAKSMATLKDKTGSDGFIRAYP